MAQVKKILIADPDEEAVHVLSQELRQRNYQIYYARDGAKALQVAVLRHPELILFDDACAQIDAKTFVQILRTNPRTEDVPVVLTSLNPDAGNNISSNRYLKKPFNIDEVLSHIEQLFRRSQAANELKGESRDIEGSLDQLPLTDLLQILAMNKRSGKLSVQRAAQKGEIVLIEGKPANAKMGMAEGEKALFRLLSWRDGSFAFAPAKEGVPPPKVQIQRSMDDALLEGMRHSDEVARLSAGLPALDSRIQWAGDTQLPPDQHPVTSQVVEILKFPRTIQELVDLCVATDLEVLSVLSTLFQKGMVAPIKGGRETEGSRPLLGPAEVHALRARIFKGRTPSMLAIAKVFICCGAPELSRRVIEQLPGFQALSAQPQAVRSSFGTLGRFQISEALQIDFFILPPRDAAKPLWRPFASGMVGALLLDVSGPSVMMAKHLGWEMRVPLVVVDQLVPSELSGAPSGCIATGSDLVRALETLLMQSLRNG